MEVSTLATVAFAVGVVGNSVKAVPQFLRTAVRGNVAGLAPTTVWLACTANILWLCFGLSIGDERFVVLMAFGTALTTATLSRFVARTGRTVNGPRAAIFVPAWGLFALAAAAGYSLTLETLGTGLGVTITLPQLLHLWRTRRDVIDVSGISQAEYKIVIAAQVAWTTYWLIQGHPIAAVGAAWGGTSRLITLGLVRSQARRGHGTQARSADAKACQVTEWNTYDEMIRLNGVQIDRPRGTSHPDYADWIYPLDYGHIPNTRAEDGEEVDVFIGSSSGGVVGMVTVRHGGCEEAKLLWNTNDEEIESAISFLEGSLEIVRLRRRPVARGHNAKSTGTPAP